MIALERIFVPEARDKPVSSQPPVMREAPPSSVHVEPPSVDCSKNTWLASGAEPPRNHSMRELPVKLSFSTGTVFSKRTIPPTPTLPTFEK